MKFQVIIPNWESFYVKSNKTATKYWLYSDITKLPKKYLSLLVDKPLVVGKKTYCQDKDGNRFVKNPKKAGKPNIWILNGQDLYNAKLNWRLRKVVAKYYHEYMSKHIQEQLSPIVLKNNERLSISCDIYEIKRKRMPDVSNMWLLEKFFEDSLIESGIIVDDNPDYVIESGRKRYHWVDTEDQRKLIFNIEIILV